MEIEDFWENCHKTDSKDYLSGCTYEDTIKYLGIQAMIKPNINVLEIGVGLGHVTQGLKAQGINVSCLEISEKGIERVRSICDNVYKPDDTYKMLSNYFDVILCWNVVQHVPTEILIKELRDCVRALNFNGVFAIQFVSNDNIEDFGQNPSLSTMQDGGCFRSPEFMKSTFESFGADVEHILERVVGIGGVDRDHVFHVRKRADEGV